MKFRLYLLGLLGLFVAYVALEYYRPKPLDWTPTFANKDKIPFGTYALFDQLPGLMRTDSVVSVRLPVYNQLWGEDEPEPEAETDSAASDGYRSGRGDSARYDAPPAPPVDEGRAPAADTAAATSDFVEPAAAADSAAAASAENYAAQSPADDSAQTAADGETDGTPNQGEEEAEENEPAAPVNYLFVNEDFRLSKLETHALLDFVAQGNDVFIAANRFGESFGRRGSFHDTLGFHVETRDLAPKTGPDGSVTFDSVQVQLANPALRAAAGGPVRLPGLGAAYRLVLDSASRAQGATLATDDAGGAVLVRLDHGRGHFYLCTVPLAFTNYFVLKPRAGNFAFAALSYLPAGRPVWWDEFQKQGRYGEQSLLRVLLAHDALRTAYYLLLLITLLLVVNGARRRQRIIPVIKPLPNTTLLFTRTVASLYRQGNSHRLMAEKKVALFLDFLRQRFHEPQPDLGDEAFRERLSQKAGLPRPRVDELLRLVNFARTAPVVSDRELLTLSRALRDFKRESR